MDSILGILSDNLRLEPLPSRRGEPNYRHRSDHYHPPRRFSRRLRKWTYRVRDGHHGDRPVALHDFTARSGVPCDHLLRGIAAPDTADDLAYD